MQYDCGRRRDRLSNWHRWFAWYPVRMGENDCRWLEWVSRKGEFEYCGMGFNWSWAYKGISNAYASKGR